MFKIGDKVVYPMHGAGVIEKIEEKEKKTTGINNLKVAYNKVFAKFALAPKNCICFPIFIGETQHAIP